MAKKDTRNSTPKSDERNIVGSNQVDIQDIEDQVIMIWEKNKGLIIGGIAFVFAAFLAFQGFKFLDRRAEANLKEGYLAANTPAAKLAWAQEESGSALSGFAFKELGDAAYSEGDFAQAAERYREALAAAESPVKEAASLALAMTLLKQDNTAEAKKHLNALASDPSAPNQAEAQYRLAQIASSEGDVATARSLIEDIDESAIFWKSRARSLETSLPDA